MSALQPSRPIYEASRAELIAQLPVIGKGIEGAFEALGRAPTMATANQVAAQLAGAQAFVQRLRERLRAEAGGDGQ